MANITEKIKKGKSLPDGCSGHPIVTEKNKKNKGQRPPRCRHHQLLRPSAEERDGPAA
jgi:hypothetical protein